MRSPANGALPSLTHAQNVVKLEGILETEDFPHHRSSYPSIESAGQGHAVGRKPLPPVMSLALIYHQSRLHILLFNLANTATLV